MAGLARKLSCHDAKIDSLSELLKKGVKWAWNDELEHAFKERKTLFCRSVLLNYSK